MSESHLPNAETVHRAFRGASEVAKKKRTITLCLELTAASLALAGIFIESISTVWTAATSLALAVSACGLRLWADHDSALSQSWRRTALRAYINGVDLSGFDHFDVTKRLPWLSIYLAAKLPAQSLDDYYTAKSPPGPRRQQEAYACSAFYTASLMKIQFFGSAALAIIIVIATFVGFIALFSSPPPAADRGRLLEMLCSVILAVLVLRLAEYSVRCGIAWRTADSLAVQLIQDKDWNEDELMHLSECYDFERIGSPAPSTWLYKLNRSRLDEQWGVCFRALQDAWAKHGDRATETEGPQSRGLTGL